MKKSTKWLLAIFGVALLGFLFFSLGSADSGKYDEFARCITEKGAVMHGAFWCPHCQSQKSLFGSSFKYVNYVECDPRGDNAREELCKERNVEGYPTWIFADEERRSGEIPLRELALRTNCTLPE